MKLFSKQSPGRIIALGFLAVILLGSVILMSPVCVRDNVELRYIDALYTSTSAVCVTGLLVVDTNDTYTPFGQAIIALLIQTGGLGVATVGAGVMLAMRKRINLKGRTLLREAMNTDSSGGLVRFVKSILLTTLVFEFVGVVLSFLVFAQDFPPLHALGISVFHSIATFNNSGFDIMGHFQGMVPYYNNYLLNAVTCFLIFFGGIGFLVIRDLKSNRFRFRKLTLHSKVVISVSLALIVIGTVMLKLSEDITWLAAFFHSVSARTAGFSTYPIGKLTNGGLLVLCALMFVGASPGSTGGGIKTSTLFVLLHGVKAAATNKCPKAFCYSLPRTMFEKACVVTLLSAAVVGFGTYAMSLLEPHLRLMDTLFEVISAFGTVGLSTGISPGLCTASKFLTICVMYIGRLGPLTIASLWYFGNTERVKYPEGNVAIG